MYIYTQFSHEEICCEFTHRKCQATINEIGISHCIYYRQIELYFIMVESRDDFIDYILGFLYFLGMYKRQYSLIVILHQNIYCQFDAFYL